MLIKLGMESAVGLNMRTPIHKPIEDMWDISKAQVSFFMSACGMSGWLASTGRPDMKYTHSRISQHMSAPKRGALAAVIHTMKYCTSTLTACLFQPYGCDGEWRLTTDSDHAGNAEAQNKRHSQLAHMAMCGKALVDWGSKATAVQTVAWPEGDDQWATAKLPAEGPMLTCHPLARDLHADVSSDPVEIYAGSGPSQGLWLSYISGELGVSFPTPVSIGIDNATAVAHASGTVKCSKIRHIDARQDWVGAMRNSSICKLWKANTKENESDLLTKIHEADQFE